MRRALVSSFAFDHLVGSEGILLGYGHSTVQLVRVTRIGYFVEHSDRERLSTSELEIGFSVVVRGVTVR